MHRAYRHLAILFFALPALYYPATASAQQNPPDSSTATQNNPPYFTSIISAQTVKLGDNVTFTLAGADAEGDAFTFALAPVPSGTALPPSAVIINGSTFQWQPTAANTAGTTHFAVRFRIVDAAHNQETTQDVDFFIGNAQAPPIFTTLPISTNAEEGTPFRVTLQAYDPNPADRPNLTFSLNGEPVGAVVDPKSGVLSWTPPTSTVIGGGTRPITFSARVSDGVLGNEPATLPISLTVKDITVISMSIWNRDVCQLGSALTEVDKMATTYRRAASNRTTAKSAFGLVAALIAVLTPFGDDIGGSDLPLGLGVSAAVIGVITERLPDPGPRQRQAAVLQRSQNDLRAHSLRFATTTADVRDAEQLQIRTDALNANTRAGADVQAVELTISPATTCH